MTVEPEAEYHLYHCHADDPRIRVRFYLPRSPSLAYRDFSLSRFPSLQVLYLCIHPAIFLSPVPLSYLSLSLSPLKLSPPLPPSPPPPPSLLLLSLFLLPSVCRDCVGNGSLYFQHR